MSDIKEQLRDTLLGTCLSVEEAATQLGLDLSSQEALDLVADTDIEICDQCGWWCEQSELDENQRCDDCQEPDPEDDE